MRLFRSLLVCFFLIGCASIGLHCHPGTDGADSSNANADSGPTVASVELVDQFSRPVRTEDLRGKVWIATVTFTRSRSNSPRQIAMMAELRDRIEREGLWHSVRLLNISAEPENDTPRVLREYASGAGADSTHWRFLTGPRNEVADLVESIGLPLLDDARTSTSPISLSPQFVLIDRAMRVRGAYDLNDPDQHEALIADLGRVLPEMPLIADDSGRTHLVAPLANADLSWIDRRRREQISRSEAFGIFHDFGFRDRQPESGITFRNKIVDNAGKHWMPNHYDHGNGVAIADVDGDGRLDLYFVTQVGSNELWRNLGNGRFENITDAAGVSLDDRIGVSASFADIDNDGDADLYATTVKGGNVLFENDGRGTFTDISEHSGTDYRGHSSAALFFDYDRDGLLDLFLLNVGVYTSDNLIPVTNGTSAEQRSGHYHFYEGYEDAFSAHIKPGRSERSVLYRNLGDGRFEDVTEATGLVDGGWSGDATPIDANGDGWLDLYILNMQGDDRYFENRSGERFVRKGADIFPTTPWGSMGVKSFDYDNDGRMDLFLTDMHSDMSEEVGPDREKRKAHMQWPDTLLAGGENNIFGNAFFRKTSDGFREVSDVIGAENYWPWGVSVGDLNADGYQDAFVASSMNYPFRYGINTVLLNERGERFVDSEYVLGVEPRREDRVLTPWMELHCGGADEGHEHCEGRSDEVVVWGSRGSRSSAIFDLDGDGDLDVVTNDFNSEPLVLVSDLGERREDLRYLKIRLVGTESNRDALGSRISVEVADQRYTQVYDGLTGYLSHGLHPLYFGLADAAAVDRIVVNWPSGRMQTIEGPIETNRLLEIAEE